MPWDPPAGETPAQIPFEIQPDANQGQPVQEQPAQEPVPQQPAQSEQPGQKQPAQNKPAPEVKVERVANPVAEFSGIDKITGRIINFDADIGETVQFGALRVKTDACYTRPATEAANTDAFVEVDEITLQGEVRRIFSGWMFAASPGLHGVEHPIYDIWLTDCKQPEVVANQQETRPAPATVQKRQPPRQQPRPQPQQQLLPPPGFPAFRQ